MSEHKIQKQYTFPIGDTLTAKDGSSYRIVGYLGRGGQGEVYHVVGGDGEYAAKWYHVDRCLSKINAEAFHRNLERNVERGVPQLSSGDAATQFIWPLKMLERRNQSFGYLMKIFPKGYEPLKNVFFMRKKDSKTGQTVSLHWGSWFICVTAALNIVRAFEILHKSGLSYQDLNDGGISINMKTGDVLICDCDNVSPDKTNLGIRGVMEYMAPEVVRGEKLPDRLTDQYSLAVILFRLFMHDHPMKGMESRELHNSEQISQREADIMIFGSQPHYVLATKDNKNPPDPVFNEDVCRLCLAFPLSMMNAFEQIFTKGVHDPSQRLTATEWRKVLLDVRDHLVQINGREAFFGLRVKKNPPPECRTLTDRKDIKILCMPGKLLYAYHADEYSTDFKTPIGKIIPTSKQGYIGLYNATGEPVTYSLNGKTEICPDKGKMPLLKGNTVTIGKRTYEIE